MLSAWWDVIRLEIFILKGVEDICGFEPQRSSISLTLWKNRSACHMEKGLSQEEKEGGQLALLS